MNKLPGKGGDEGDSGDGPPIKKAPPKPPIGATSTAPTTGGAGGAAVNPVVSAGSVAIVSPFRAPDGSPVNVQLGTSGLVANANGTGKDNVLRRYWVDGQGAHYSIGNSAPLTIKTTLRNSDVIITQHGPMT